MERLISFSQGIKGYMLACSLKTRMAEHKECSYIYKDERNVSGCSSWIVRCNFDMETFEWSCSEERKQESLLLIDEKVYSMLEYARNNMLISLAFTNLLVVHDWKPVKLIANNSPANIYKNYLLKLPMFDE